MTTHTAKGDTNPVQPEEESTVVSEANLDGSEGGETTTRHISSAEAGGDEGVEGEPGSVEAEGDEAIEGGADFVDTGEEALSENEADLVLAPVEGLAEGEAGITEAAEEIEERKKRRRLLALLLVLLAMLICVSAMLVRYLWQPEPLPDLLPVPVNLNYAPHYLFSIYGMEKPVGVAVSPQGDWIYVTESGGERLVRVFDRDGNPLSSFAPPRTRSAERSPVYLAVDGGGRVFVTDRLQHAVFVYDREGNYLDTILGPELTLSEYVYEHVDDLQQETTFVYNVFWSDVYYQEPGEVEQSLPEPGPLDWAPLGIRLDDQGNMLLTDVDADHNLVRRIPAAAVRSASWHDFEPQQRIFGESGQGTGQLLFPNSAVSDAQGQIFVTDGNNGRISVWNDQGGFLFSFGQGNGDGALSLPRGAAIDARDRLHVVDAVGQTVKVYDVSGPEPSFLFAFGDWGLGDGEFNYPNDIALDAGGRLYIADRENNRIQVWSY